jgi:hypothetical protein
MGESQQVLTADNTPPKVSAKFYKAVVQSILLQDLEPLANRFGAAGGVSHLRSLPDCQETQAKEGTASQVGVPTVLWCSTQVQNGHHLALHQHQEGHNL